MLNPFIELIGTILHFYGLIVIIWTIMSMLFQFNVLSRSNMIVNRVFLALGQMVEPALAPIRKRLWKWFPRMTMIDLSPLVLILLLNFISSALYHWFYSA